MPFSKPVLLMFFIVLLELIGLGMIIPLSPYMARYFGADDLQVGLLMSIYSVIQLVVAPFWGKCSDRWGRKPVLLISLIFTSLSYLWFALAPNLSHLFFSRALAGVFGVTVSTAFAYISDQTSSQKRSKNMALVGAAFGLGFVIGPALGSVLGTFKMGLATVAFGASAIVLGGWLFATFFLKESHVYDVQMSTKKQWLPDIFSLRFRQAFKHKSLQKVLLIFFILSLSLTLVEAPLFLLMKDRFDWSLSLSSLGFAYIGFILALTQGFFVQYWIPYWGEKKINQAGLFLFLIGLFGLCFHELRVVGLAVTIMSLGFGLSYTSLTGGVSLLTKKSHQGGTLGIHQSLSSLARILGPALGGWLYRDLGYQAPFLLAGGLASLGFILSLVFKKYIPDSGKEVQQDSEDLEYVKINWFQLNNLIKNQAHFSFFYLQSSDHVQKTDDLDSSLQKILSLAQRVTPDSLLKLELSSKNPIVLICEDGVMSQKQALLLVKKWTNVFYVEGGIQSFSNSSTE